MPAWIQNPLWDPLPSSARRKTVEPPQPSELRALIDRALADKVLTRAEQQQILNAVAADQEVSPEEHDSSQ
ncbi:hypothetical protein CYA_1771 [Synechococcus sp. JA-3-3Ab]|nr:hypothetical protein CYA_1771 [Synechococcus sp. JA-3-3Ab]